MTDTPIDNNLKTTAALGKPKLSDVPPIALFALGAAMSDGAKKYGRFNWRKTSTTSSVFYDAMMRHLTAWYSGENYATDSKVHHLGHLMANCAIILDSEVNDSLNDDRDKLVINNDAIDYFVYDQGVINELETLRRYAKCTVDGYHDSEWSESVYSGDLTHDEVIFLKDNYTK